MDNDRKVTITDVAKLAGVSKGTVDRVLHERGEVSKKSAEKVRKAIKELGYEPNIYASLLATRKERLIVCLLPEYNKGEYWGMIENGCHLGQARVEHLDIKVQVEKYSQYEMASFRKKAAQVIEMEPSGVILPPVFKNDAHWFVGELSRHGIPYVFVDTKIEDDNYFAYFGMPMYKSGYLCADLLTKRTDAEELKELAIVRIIRDKNGQADPTIARREGFNDYMAEHFPECQIHNIFISPADRNETFRVLEDFFKEHPNIKFVSMFSSRVHILADYLKEHPEMQMRVVGFDNLEKNIDSLSDGLIDALIAQHTEQQSLSAVEVLSDWLILRKTPAKKDNYMHMDILTRLNIDNY